MRAERTRTPESKRPLSAEECDQFFHAILSGIKRVPQHDFYASISGAAKAAELSLHGADVSRGSLEHISEENLAFLVEKTQRMHASRGVSNKEIHTDRIRNLWKNQSRLVGVTLGVLVGVLRPDARTRTFDALPAEDKETAIAILSEIRDYIADQQTDLRDLHRLILELNEAKKITAEDEHEAITDTYEKLIDDVIFRWIKPTEAILTRHFKGRRNVDRAFIERLTYGLLELEARAPRS